LREFTPAALAAVAAISGCILALFVARAVARLQAPRRLLATVGRHTLAIFLLHVSIQKVLLGGSTSWVAGALAAVAAIGISMAVSFFAQAAWVRWQDRRARLTPPAREVAT
jgi:fucose 4-O-acetylase-like acetyltransferase